MADRRWLKFGALAVVALAALPSVVRAAAFSYRKKITIDRTKVGASGGSSTTLTNYPMLFSVTDTDLKSTANGGRVTSSSGFDIIFRAIDTGTCGSGSLANCTLAHEQESYTATTGAAIYWVKLPSVNAVAASSDTSIYVYYGNSSVTASTAMVTTVWNTNYKGVWHLKETGSPPATWADSTTNGRTLTTTNNPISQTSGKIGNSLEFDTTDNDAVEASNQTDFDVAPFTFSAWIYPTELPTTSTHNGYYMAKRHSAGPWEAWMIWSLGSAGGDANKFQMIVRDANQTWYGTPANAAMSINTWYNVVGNIDSSKVVRLYINGAQQTATSTLTTTPAVFDSDSVLRSGEGSGTTAAGYYDEFRFSDLQRSEDWIAADYNNQNSPSTFYSVGAEISGTPSAVGLQDFYAREDDQGVFLGWETGFEVNNMGFHLYRDQAGQRIRITPRLVAGSALLAGQGVAMTAEHAYGWRDYVAPWQAAPGKYWLESVDLNGNSTWHGPVEVHSNSTVTFPPDRVAPLPKRGRDYADPPLALARDNYAPLRPPPVSPMLNQVGAGDEVWGDDAARLTKTVERRLVLPPVTADARAVQWALAGNPGVKLGVSQEGWYMVGPRELAAAGLDPAADPRMLRLFADGQEQALVVRSDGGIEFYGLGLDTQWTGTRTYWLVADRGVNSGKRVKPAPTGYKQSRGKLWGLFSWVPWHGWWGKGPRTFVAMGLPGGSFLTTVERADRTLYVAAIKNGDESNFFGPAIGASPVEQIVNVPHLDSLVTVNNTKLAVTLQGLTADPHMVGVSLNGMPLGHLALAGGQKQAVFEAAIPPGLLKAGENRVAVAPTGDGKGVSLLVSIAVTYPRTYTADDGVLRFTLNTGARVTVDGFGSAAIRVMDVTDANAVVEVAGTPAAQTSSGHGVTVTAPGKSGARKLLAFEPDAVKAPASIKAHKPSSIHWGAADMIVIASGAMLEKVAPLVKLRQSQGLAVTALDVDTVYGEFSFGAKSPAAIRDFLIHAKYNWTQPPRFVLLVGDASFDPRNRLGRGDADLVPTKLVDTLQLETASDDWLADFNGDGIADIAIGRLPARTPEEAGIMVGKTLARELALASGADWTRNTLLVADKRDSTAANVPDFPGIISSMSSMLPIDGEVHSIFRGLTGDAATKLDLLTRLNGGGTGLVNYLGHGSTGVWRGNLLTLTDADKLTNGAQLPVYVSMTCLNGFFHDMYSDTLAEALLKAPSGGAAAVWASSGMSDPEGQAYMNGEFFHLMAERDLRLGEATMRAKTTTDDMDVRRTWILFGDPATKIR